MKRFLFWLLGAASLILASAAMAAEKPVLLVFGDSLSAGYGLSAGQAWPVHLDSLLAAAGKNIRVVNASVSGETTAGGLTRFPNALKQHKPKWVVIELGANDGLRGLPLDKAKANLVAMVKQAKAAKAKVHLIGMQLPPNFGPDYTQRFAAIYGEIAREQKTGLTPFLLAQVINKPQWFQADQLHPVAEAEPAIAKMMARDLGPLL